MKSKIISIIFIGVVVTVMAYSFGQSSERVEEPSKAPVIAATIYRTNEGFSLAEATIKKGEAVAFVNSSENDMWPASDLHPTHEIYPEFDPRKPVAPGDSWTFVFKKAGEWKFHDHIKANLRGTITVE